MSTQSHTIVPALASDLPTIAKFIYASNLAQPTNQFLFVDWPNESAQISLYLGSIEKTFHGPHYEMYKIVDNESQEIIASLILTRKTPSKIDSSTPAKMEISEVPVGVNPEFRSVLGKTLAGVQKDMAEIDHYSLSSIYVKTGYRDRGLGSQLVRLCLDKARYAGIPLFLCSVPSAHGFYRKLGFVDVAYVDIDLSVWGVKYGGYGIYRLQGMLASI